MCIRDRTRPDLAQVVDRIDVGNDGMMARALQPLVIETAARAPADDRRLGHGDCAERLAYPQSGHDPRHVCYQALRQVAHLGARVGDDLLALAVIQLLRHLERLAGRPAEARGAEFLQRRQIVQLGWPLSLILDAHSKRALEAQSCIDYVLGNLAPDNPVLRRVPHLELAARNLRGGDSFKIGEWHEVEDFQLALADNSQGRRLHSANPDYSPRALTEDDSRGAGE